MRMRTALAGAALLLAAGTAGVVASRNEPARPPQDVANDISARIMSPFCPGVTLHDCPSDRASELRAEIASWAANGASEAEIVGRLENEYGGGTIRAVPPDEGAGLLVWLVPFAAAAGGGVLAWWAARRWSAARRDEGPAPTPLSPEDRSRVAQELRTLRAEE